MWRKGKFRLGRRQQQWGPRLLILPFRGKGSFSHHREVRRFYQARGIDFQTGELHPGQAIPESAEVFSGAPLTDRGAEGIWSELHILFERLTAPAIPPTFY